MTREQIIEILNDIIEPVPLKTKEAITDALWQIINTADKLTDSIEKQENENK